MFTARIETNDFNRLINASKGFCAPPSSVINSTYNFTRYIMLQFDAENNVVTAVALDGVRLSVEHAVISNCETSFSAYINPSIKLPRNEIATIVLNDNELTIRCNEVICGIMQPNFKEKFNYRKILPENEPVYRIGFNADYLLKALQAAKASVNGAFKSPVILEFRTPSTPIVLRTNNEDIKLVCPVRLKD